MKAVENLLDRLELNVPGELSFRQEVGEKRGFRVLSINLKQLER